MTDQPSPVWIFKHNCPSVEDVSADAILSTVNNPDEVRGICTARTNMAVELNDGAALRSIQACEAYLPFAKAIQKEMISASEKGFHRLGLEWNTPFSSSHISTTLCLSNIQQEIVLVMMSQACMCRRAAWETLAEMGANSDEDKIKFINNKLCVAAGIFDNLAKMPLASLNTKGATVYEFNAEFCTAMSEICLFEAQAFVLRKAVAGGKTGPKVCMRLAYDMSLRARHSADLLSRLVGKKGVDEMRLFLLLKYSELSDIIYKIIFATHAARAFMEDSKCGIALGFMRSAIPTPNQRKVIADGNVKKSMPGYLKLTNDTIDAHTKYLNSLEGSNKTVYFETVPPEEKLPEIEALNISKLIDFSIPEAAPISFQKKDANCAFM